MSLPYRIAKISIIPDTAKFSVRRRSATLENYDMELNFSTMMVGIEKMFNFAAQKNRYNK